MAAKEYLETQAFINKTDIAPDNSINKVNTDALFKMKTYV